MIDYFNKLKKFTFYEWILFLFPFSQVLGSTFVNFFLIFSSCLFIYELIKKKIFYRINNATWIYFYIIFIFYNLLRGFFSTDSIAAIINSFSQLRFLFLALFFYLCVENKNNIKPMMLGWLILIIFVCFDAFYQYFFLKDLFGYPIVQGYPSGSIRLSGPFGKRLVVGSFIAYISIPVVSYYFSLFKDFSFLKKSFSILIYLLLLLSIILSGERLPFLIFVLTTILIFIRYLDFKKIIISILLIILFLIGTYFKNESFKLRVNDFNHILSDFHNSSYGRLYESSYLLFKKNYIFGVGLKNYRIDCDRQIDPRPKHRFQFCSTHPHNLYLEILTETGLVGFFIFVISFVYFFNFVKKEVEKNNLNFRKYFAVAYGNLIVLAIYFWPLKTSGSFFTTWNGSFFWFNLGVLLLMARKPSKI